MTDPPIRTHLRAWRVRKNLSQRALAERSGVHWGTILRLEKHPEQKPWPQTAEALAEALGIPVSRLYDDPGKGN